MLRRVEREGWGEEGRGKVRGEGRGNVVGREGELSKRSLEVRRVVMRTVGVERLGIEYQARGGWCER